MTVRMNGGAYEWRCVTSQCRGGVVVGCIESAVFMNGQL